MRQIVRQTIIFILMLTVVTTVSAGVAAVDKEALDKARCDTASIIMETVKNPVVGSVGGEWAVLGLARSGYDVPRAFYDGYYKTVEKYVEGLGGVLHEKKYTEYSRVILGLTAAGFDVRNIGGYDLTLPLGDFEKTIWQGINGPVFALIALDSARYDIPKNPNAAVQAARDMYIEEILGRQLQDGGFALSTSETTADPDLTAMTLQALAKYQSRSDVKNAIEKALECLSDMQDSTGGGFLSWGEESSESIVQVIVALCELGLGIEDTRFVKEGNTLFDRLMDYYIPGKGYEHVLGGGMNQMATEQALYALCSIYRFENGLNSLYDMTDTEVINAPEKSSELPPGSGMPGKHADVNSVPVTRRDIAFSDTAGHKNKTAITELAAREIITGMGDGTFAPDAAMTRAQFAAVVTRGLGLAAETHAPFEDIAGGAWYAGFVGTAFKYGIVTGRSAEEFDPDGLITVQEAAAMISRAAKLCGMDTDMDTSETRDMLAQFGDYTTVSNWARTPLAFCFSADILPQDEFNIEPMRSITRCEIAEMLYRMLSAAELI